MTVIRLDYPINSKLDKVITLPGSKYLANRLLILAALSEKDSILRDMPHNEDIDTSIEGLSKLGATFKWQDNRLDCKGFRDLRDFSTDQINSSASGSFSRFVMPILALSNSPITLSGSEKMNSRPMEELFRVLEKIGATITSDNQSPASTLPVKVSGPIRGGHVEMSGSTSSQYISALLMAAGQLEGGISIKLKAAPVSKPYLQITIDLLEQFGIQIETDDALQNFKIESNQRYNGIDYQLESDPSSASYFLAAAAISGGHVCISNFYPERSLQGEAEFSNVLELMGCKIWQDDEGYHCQGPKQLKAVKVDMGDMPDVVQTLAAVAVFAEGATVVTNIENLAFKESNRIEDTATELRKMGITVTTTEDSLAIEGGTPTAAILDTHDDHRMAMSLALIAIKSTKIQIRDPDVVAKSFPNYWRFLEQLGYSIDSISDSKFGEQ
ncbi:MAG: 3-phosphoshikimate 1-carboxyvinyltransferase [Gammaproteobacteria bacterium]|nr:3-phosphoshikimate 1-carboxyvinyltransferase [Gammaproteobacteria bacterium]